MSEDKYIYRYSEDFGRMGYLSGLFVATDSEYRKALGSEARLGEVLGKHSYVVASITEDTVKVIEARPEFVAWFEEVVGQTGKNPVAAFLEQQDEDEDEDGD